MTNIEVAVSIVIPAYNEQDYLGTTLTAIRKYGLGVPYEVIVVDNGSLDDTAEIVKQYDCRLVDCPKGTIAAVRNKGVSESSGEILIFLDADVLVTREWQQGMTQIIAQLKKDTMIVTGSRCEAPNSNSWLNNYWFKLLGSYNAKYINSGHMITTRTLFDKVAGFSEKLQTAEDVDFCLKATVLGAVINASSDIPVVHEGYPETLSDFIQRERWHGREDFENFGSILASKVAWIVICHFIVFLFTLFGLLLGNAAYSLLFYGLVMAFVSIALTVIKFGRKGVFSTINTSGIFYFYIYGRTVAMIDRLRGHRIEKFR